MWILSIIPETIIHVIFIAGVLGTIIGFVLGFLPLVKMYKLAIQVIAITVLVFGVFLEGGLADYQQWQHKVDELKIKLAEAEVRSGDKNVEIQEKIVEKTKVIREKGKDIIQYVDREVIKKEEVIKYIENCPIPKDIIDLHNQATELNKGATK